MRKKWRTKVSPPIIKRACRSGDFRGALAAHVGHKPVQVHGISEDSLAVSVRAKRAVAITRINMEKDRIFPHRLQHAVHFLMRITNTVPGKGVEKAESYTQRRMEKQSNHAI
jgi:hypothetical protein